MAAEETGHAGDSVLTVLVALGANALIAVAKSVVAVITGSASMVAEAAHSWADTGNEVFLLIAERRSAKPRDAQHPFGYGREAYVWSMFAAFGLFGAGSVVSVWHGITALGESEPDASYGWAYAVLAIAFVLEGVSFFQASRQAKAAARRRGRNALWYITHTSNPTLRAVFFEDASALVGLLIAAIGIWLHQVTGNAVWDAAGSIAVGVLLGFVAIFLIRRNRDFLVGQSVWPELWQAAYEGLDDHEQVDRVTFLHLEFVGPSRIFLVAAVDLVGNDDEATVANRLRAIGRQVEENELIERAMITLSPSDAPTLDPSAFARPA